MSYAPVTPLYQRLSIVDYNGRMAFRVLLIDDDRQFKKLLELRLRSFLGEMSVTSLGCLDEARELFKNMQSSAFDLVFLDEHLPDGRGVELLGEGWFEGLAVLSVSSDPSPEIPGSAIGAGAAYFLPKSAVSEPLFKPLVLGVVDRNRLRQQLENARIESAKVDTVKTLVATLRHEINNPLGAVLGAAYILGNDASASAEQKEAVRLVESSGQRIKHVLDKLCEAMRLEPVSKAQHKVFHIPGDDPWVEAGGSTDKDESDEK